MRDPQFLTTKSGRSIAYHHRAGKEPGVVFLGGLRSDMSGSKAMFLQDWAERTGQAFLRFDYSGHGQSPGRFQDGAIGDWFEDAEAVLDLTTGPQILVGSSMGGWIGLLLARTLPSCIAGLVGVAAAPDFTEDAMWAGFDELQRKQLSETGQVALKSDYSDDPTVITRRMIEDGRTHLVLRKPLPLPFPTRFLQGTDDLDVPPSVALALLAHVHGPDIQLTLVKGADHRFSTPDCLGMIGTAIADVIDRLGR